MCTLAEVQRETGAVLVHPYDDARVIAGQGTAALELLAQAELDAIITPIGGGGLLSGTCIAVRGTAPAVALYGAEPAGADDAARSLAAGKFIPQTGPDTICDGLLSSLGELTWPILRDHLAAIITVDDDDVVQVHIELDHQTRSVHSDHKQVTLDEVEVCLFTLANVGNALVTERVFEPARDMNHVRGKVWRQVGELAPELLACARSLLEQRVPVVVRALPRHAFYLQGMFSLTRSNAHAAMSKSTGSNAAGSKTERIVSSK